MRRRIAVIYLPRDRPDIGFDPEVIERAAGQVHGALGVLGFELEPSLSMRFRRRWRKVRRERKES